MTEYLNPIIDRNIFFGNPEISGAQISPDGQYISFIKPLNGTMNLWVKRKEEPFDDAYPVTNDQKRPIRSYFWSRDSRYILYVQDKGGDENYHIYAVNPSIDIREGNETGVRDLTPFEDITAFILHLPKFDEDLIYVGINDRDKAWHDYYKLRISTGERELILINENKFTAAYFDLESSLKVLSRSTDDGGTEILVPKADTYEAVLYANLEENLAPLKFNAGGQLYILSNIGKADLQGLYLLDLNTREMTLIESDPESEVDIETVSFSELSNEIIATTYIADKKRIYWKNEEFEEDYNHLISQFPESEVDIVSMTKDESEWLAVVSSDIDPGSVFHYNRSNKGSSFLYAPRPELPKKELCRMQPIKYPSFDGLMIPAYLTIPNMNSSEKLPGIIVPHGGPWARDYWGYNSFAQFLANRGYVVLQPNFRGSTGFGKSFLNAAINQWGEKMQDDLSAGADFLVEHYNVASGKIAIMGGSYGGYATLAGLAFTPDIYAAGVSIVGPSNLFTLLETIPPYWESARVMFHKRMGNPNTEEGRAQLTRQSPFFHADKIKAPLMVAQGANDPRVKKSESDQIVIAMRDHGLDVNYLNFPD
ncbi:MAG: S9 family peptidase [Bacteroidia bacterium]|nr:S9 family peptidase [Bacteroidia bacterium]